MREAAPSLRRPAEASGAQAGLSRPQKALLAAIALSAAWVCGAAADPLAWLALAASALFLPVIAVQLGAAIESAGAPGRDPQRPATAPGAARSWPPYTILAPLHREAAVAPQLVEAMRRLDYPARSLQILFLVESDDAETAAALRAVGLPAHAQVVVVPDGQPRTKPRALNHGLALARGDFVTVFDAEDIPEPNQLQRAVLAFEGAPRAAMCVQARLAIDNIADGWLPLMLAIEYAALFDTIKCGLAHSAMPVALGGTSNHFRRTDLVALGGWDAWNVAEDADLGLRIARAGGLVLDLPSTTWEEAPITLRAWMSQRRRWFKGWLQTGIAHARAPRAGIAAMGFTAWLVAQLQVIGLVLSALGFPFFSAWLLWSFATGGIWNAGSTLALAANSTALVVAMMGGLAIVVPAVMGLRRRRLWHLAPWLAVLPFYLLIVSAAAWLALRDLWLRPHHWAKTDHGLGSRGTPLLRSRR
jgi:glycosyltransferase XagB